MIIVKIEGGIGNQLFQYALGKNLAIKNNTDLKLDLNYFRKSSFRKFELNNFNIEAKEITSSKIKFIIWANSKKIFFRFIYNLFFKKPIIYKEKNFHFNNEVFKMKNGTYLEGFWQSERYFIDIKDHILDLFQNDNLFDSKFEIVINEISRSEAVALHVRRGDYLTNKNHVSLDLDYYQKAINFLISNLNNPTFYIFSDDLKWCELNLSLNAPFKYIYGNSAWEDLKLMSYCNHFIIANSTFSWWGAYLGRKPNKKVIYPRIWFPKTNTKKTDDLFLNDWIKM
jgi:hypothetical protein